MFETQQSQEIEVVDGIMAKIIHPDSEDPDYPDLGLSCEISVSEFIRLICLENRRKVLDVVNYFGSFEGTVDGHYVLSAAKRHGLDFDSISNNRVHSGTNSVLHTDSSNFLFIGKREGGTIVTGRRTGRELLVEGMEPIEKRLKREIPEDKITKLLSRNLAYLKRHRNLYPQNLLQDAFGHTTRALVHCLSSDQITEEEILNFNYGTDDAIANKKAHLIPWNAKPGTFRFAIISGHLLHARHATDLLTLHEPNPLKRAFIND